MAVIKLRLTTAPKDVAEKSLDDIKLELGKRMDAIKIFKVDWDEDTESLIFQVEVDLKEKDKAEKLAYDEVFEIVNSVIPDFKDIKVEVLK